MGLTAVVGLPLAVLALHPWDPKRLAWLSPLSPTVEGG
jgi:hypothetical protein